MVGGIIVGGLGGFGSDVVRETEIYKEARDWCAEQLDNVVEDLSGTIKELIEIRLHREDVKLEIIVSDRKIELQIYPGPRYSRPPYDDTNPN
ncbi:MAG: hypothetical protein KDK08_23095 [Rhizobiaceae bacterium]|nr:hypothetical protein [Rhizobiaceae bacterium]